MDSVEKLVFTVIGGVIAVVISLFVLAACTFDGSVGGDVDYAPAVPVQVPGVPGALIFI